MRYLVISLALFASCIGQKGVNLNPNVRTPPVELADVQKADSIYSVRNWQAAHSLDSAIKYARYRWPDNEDEYNYLYFAAWDAYHMQIACNGLAYKYTTGLDPEY